MVINYTYVFGQEITCEVHGEIRDIYLEAVGVNPDCAPDVLDLVKLEERIGRKHNRTHKYTGIPISVESITENGEQIADCTDEYTQIELRIDLERAIKELTYLQWYCFKEVCLNGMTQRDVAKKLGKSKSVITQAIYGARKKLKKYFSRIGPDD